MAEGFALKADVRERTGKGAARALRRDGLIPAVIYGNKEPPISIAVPLKEMTLALYAGGFKTHVWTIDVGGQSIQALARDYQREPVKDRLVHIDFLRVTARSRVTVNVPVHFTGEDEAPGLRLAGGVLNIVAHTVSVEAPATAIPERLDVSVAGLELNETVTSAALTLPANVVLTAADPFPLATIAPPVAEEGEPPLEPGALDAPSPTAGAAVETTDGSGSTGDDDTAEG